MNEENTVENCSRRHLSVLRIKQGQKSIFGRICELATDVNAQEWWRNILKISRYLSFDVAIVSNSRLQVLVSFTEKCMRSKVHTFHKWYKMSFYYIRFSRCLKILILQTNMHAFVFKNNKLIHALSCLWNQLLKVFWVSFYKSIQS